MKKLLFLLFALPFLATAQGTLIKAGGVKKNTEPDSTMYFEIRNTGSGATGLRFYNEDRSDSALIYLDTTGTLVVPGVGGGIPAGENTFIQYNASGEFGADSGFVRYEYQTKIEYEKEDTTLGIYVYPKDTLLTGGQPAILLLVADSGYVYSSRYASYFLLSKNESSIANVNLETGKSAALSLSPNLNYVNMSFSYSTGNSNFSLDTVAFFYSTYIVDSAANFYTHYPKVFGNIGDILTIADTTIADEGGTRRAHLEWQPAPEELPADAIGVLSNDGAGNLSWEDLNGCSPQCLSTNLSSAQLLAGNTTPVLVIADPGDGFFIEIISASYRHNFVSAEYGTATSIELYCSGSSEPVVELNNILDATSDLITKFDFTTNGFPGNITLCESEAVYFRVKTTDPVDGDCTGTVYVQYRIVEL